MTNLTKNKISQSLSLGLCFPLLAFSMDAMSQTPVEQEISRLKNQQQAISSEKALQQANQFLSNPSKPVAKPWIEKADHSPLAIKQIEIDLAGESAPLDFSAITQRYQGAALSNELVLNLVKELTEALYSAGYVTSAIGLKSEKVIDGKLSLLVHWGKIDQLWVNGQPPINWKDKGMLMTLPRLKGTVFNLHTLDQLVEMLNNSHKTVSINVKASEKVAHSHLDFDTKRRALPVLQLGFNNSGAERQGRDQATATLRMDDLMGINDQWAFSTGYRFYQQHKKHNQINYAIHYTQPFSFYLFESKFAQSSYEKALQGQNGEYQSGGKTQSINLKLSRILQRDKENILSLYGELEFKNKQNRVANRTVLNRHENKWNIGLSYITNFLNGKFYGEFSYSNGLNWSHSDRLAYSGKKDKTLRTLNTNITWFKPITVLPRRANYQLRMGAQYSPYHLYSDNQFSLGDEYTVRGFKGGVISGENGFYVSQTFSLPFYPQKYQITQIAPFVGWDIGKVYKKREQHNTISGIASGVKIHFNHLSLSLTYAKPLHKPKTQNYHSVYYLNGNVEF